MKVALITSMKSGLTQFIYRDVLGLLQRGHDVRLFSLITRRGLFNPKEGWEVVHASRLGAALGLIRLLRRRPKDAIELIRHALSFGALADLGVAAQFLPQLKDRDLIFCYFGDHKLFAGYYCKRLTGLPLVVTVRAYELYRNPNERMFRESLAACDLVLTITEHNRRELVERYGVPDDKITIVRQSVELDLFHPRDKLSILIVGYFAEKKGHDVLFEAFRRMGRDDAELWVVGDWNPSILSTDVRGMAKEKGIEEKIAFFGALKGPALRALYRTCDVFCLPSRTDSKGDKEGFPNVVAEAMATGKPIVSTRHAGIPEAIEAVLVDENDPEGLAAALNEVLDSPELREQLGRRNRARAEEMFSPGNHDELELALKGALAERGGS